MLDLFDFSCNASLSATDYSEIANIWSEYVNGKCLYRLATNSDRATISQV
jgi:hypothetical protein